jgi:hypothetical protein
MPQDQKSLREALEWCSRGSVVKEKEGSYRVGEEVERRDGIAEFRRGFVTQLSPLKVTLSTDPSAQEQSGYTWDDVRKVLVGTVLTKPNESTGDVDILWSNGLVTSRNQEGSNNYVNVSALREATTGDIQRAGAWCKVGEGCVKGDKIATVMFKDTKLLVMGVSHVCSVANALGRLADVTFDEGENADE